MRWGDASAMMLSRMPLKYASLLTMSARNLPLGESLRRRASNSGALLTWANVQRLAESTRGGFDFLQLRRELPDFWD